MLLLGPHSSDADDSKWRKGGTKRGFSKYLARRRKYRDIHGIILQGGKDFTTSNVWRRTQQFAIVAEQKQL